MTKETELPEGWKILQIQDIASVDSGQGAPQGDKWYKGNEIFVKAGSLNNLSEGKFVGDFCSSIGYDAIEKYKLKKYAANSIVFPKSGMSVKTDNIALLKCDSYIVNHLAIIQINKNNECDHKYLYYFLKRMKISNLSLNSAYPSIRLQDIKKVRIIIPPLPTQKKIAAILEKAEALKEWRNEADRLTYEFLKSTFLEMFGEPIRNKHKWENKRLEECGTWQSGGTPSRSNDDYFEGTIPWYTAGELNSLFTSDSLEKITEDAIKESAAKLIPPNTLLLGMYDTAALKSSITTIDCACNQAIASSKLDSGIVNIFYLYYTLQIAKKYYIRQQRGVRQKNLNLSMIKNFEVPVPPLELQNKFADIVQQIENLRKKQSQSKQHIEDLFNNLMQQAFKGELAC